MYNGERVVVLRTNLFLRRLSFLPGDIVAVRDPRQTRRILIKRISEINDDKVLVMGDNPLASTDSRTFGPITLDMVLGKVIYRYWPPNKAEWFGRKSRKSGK